MSGFKSAKTETLLKIRDNLRNGLDLVAARIEAGTFEVILPKKATPASESGQITLILLAGVEEELESRGGGSGEDKGGVPRAGTGRAQKTARGAQSVRK